MVMIKMAFRNIFRQKRRSVLTGLAIGGGFFLSAVAIGWSDGSYNDIIDMFTKSRDGHVQVHKKGYLEKPSLYKTIDSYTKVMDSVKNVNEVEACAPRIYSAGLVSSGEKSCAARVIGMDPELEDKATNISKKVFKGDMLRDKASMDVMLGKGLAERLDAEPRDSIVVVSQGADGSIANDIYRIYGIVKTGNAAEDRMNFYMHIDDAQELFVLHGSIHEIAVIGKSASEARELSKRIQGHLSREGIEVVPWQVFAKSFYRAMKVDMQGMWIMLGIIILIMAVGVLNTVLMSVLERQREYGLLKALGTKPINVFGLILIEVFFLVVISLVGGSILALISNSALAVYGIRIPEPFTYGGMKFEYMRAEVNLRSFVIPGIFVMLSALLVSIIPGIRAARTEPAVTMKNN